MPKASELQDTPYLRVLILGDPKVGKTTMAVGSSPGPLHVLLCEDDSALIPARRVVKTDFGFTRISGLDTMTDAVLRLKTRAKKGKLKTVIVDTLSAFGESVLEECLIEARDNTRAGYGKYNRVLSQAADQLLRLPCHLVVLSHYENDSEDDDDEGGRVPMLAGKAKKRIAGKFPDVVWMDYNGGKRILVTGPTGAWGPGCRHSSETKKLNADVLSGKKTVGIKALIKHFGLSVPPSVAAASES
jgi:hypothetical protein